MQINLTFVILLVIIADKAISYIRETLLVPDSHVHTKYVSNMDEALEYLEELPFDETTSQYYDRVTNATENYHDNTITNLFI